MRGLATEVLAYFFVVGLIGLYLGAFAWLTVLPSIGAAYLLGWLK